MEKLLMAFSFSGFQSRYCLSVAVAACISVSGAFAQDSNDGSAPSSTPTPAASSEQTTPPVVPVDQAVVPASPGAPPTRPVAPAGAPAVTVAAVPEAVSCFVSPAKLPAEKISEFSGDPQSLLLGTESGGMILSGRVGGLAGSSSDTLDTIMALTATANKQQVEAIGKGLARAAIVCTQVSPPYAALIQSKVADMNNEALSLAFVEELSEVQTASVSSGAGGASSGASGIGGNGTAGGGSAGEFGDDSVSTTSGTFNGIHGRSAFNVPTDGSSSLLTSPN